MVFIFGTMIACRVKITINVSENGYALGVKGKGQIFLKSVLRKSVTQTSLSFLMV